MKSPLSINEFNDKENFYDLIIAVSYEDRGLTSLERIINKFKIANVSLLIFDVENYLEINDLTNWKKQHRDMVKRLISKNINYTEIPLNHNSFEIPLTLTVDSSAHKKNLLIDITTLPKNYILLFAKYFDFQNTLFVYTRGDSHRTPAKDEKFIGITQIIPIDGFEGEIDINKEDLLVLILGFEGNRAFSFLSDFPSNKIIALVGRPSFSIDVDKKYIEHARKCNEFLLNNSTVTEEIVDSYNHFRFADSLESILKESQQSCNICIAPIGTKAETLGLYSYWKKHKNIQILYPIPNKRVNIAIGIGDTLVYSLNW